MKHLPHLMMLGLVLGLVGCGGDDPPPPPPPPPPTVVSVTLNAAADVNPSGAGLPSPVVVQVYQLSGITSFAETDFFSLQQDASSALGDELIETETFVLPPGAVEVYQREVGEDVRFIGVTAAFRDISAGTWRGFQPVPPETTTLLEADITGTAVTLRKSGL